MMIHEIAEIIDPRPSSCHYTEPGQIYFKFMQARVDFEAKETQTPKSRFYTQRGLGSFQKETSEPITSKASMKKVLILDLDETLIHSYKQQPAHVAEKITMQTTRETVTFWVTKRPNLENFLQDMSQIFEIVIYTAGIQEYAEAILDQLGVQMYFSRIFHREHCTRLADSLFLKDINVVGQNLQDMVLIDDAAHQVKHQPQNSLQIVPFDGDLSDQWLATLSPFLKKLADCDDVRSVMRKFDLFMLGHELPSESCEEIVRFTQMVKPKKKKDLGPILQLMRFDSCCPDVTMDEGITPTAKDQIERLAGEVAVKKELLTSKQ